MAGSPWCALRRGVRHERRSLPTVESSGIERARVRIVSPMREVLTPALTWWRGLAARERMGLTLAGAVLLGYGLWATAIGPALQTLKRAPLEHDLLESQFQTMQRLAAEAQQLRATPTLPADAALAALKTATDRLGDKGRLNLQGERAVLVLSGVSPQALQDWLAEARQGARARPLQAELNRSAAGYSGTLVVGIGGGS